MADTLMTSSHLWPQWLPPPATRCLTRIETLLPLLYLLWVLPLALVLAVVTPPWQNPDEAGHMLRIVQIALGGVMAHHFDHDAGGVSDPAVLRSLLAVLSVFRHYDHKVTLDMLAKAGAVQWGTPAQVGFATIARYGPVLYLPAVAAVAVARLAGLSVVHGLIAARMANAVAAAGLAAFALSLARRTRLLLAVLLVLPMTVALFASAAHDALLIALTVTVIACADRIIDADRDPLVWENLLIGVGTVLLVQGRPTYLPMAALPLVCSWRLHRRAWAIAAAVALAGLAWSIYVAAALSVPLRPGLNAGAQLAYLLHRPWMIVPIAVNTWVRSHTGDIDAFIGVLGSLDTPLPDGFYAFGLLVVAVALASVAAAPARRTWLAWLIGLAVMGAIELSQYLTWTPLYADHVDGMQGRYYLAPLAIVALAVPGWRPVGATLRPLALVALLGFALVTPMVMVHALVLRYYLAP